MEKRLEDGQLGAKGGEVCITEGCAMGGIGGGKRGTILESREADATAGGHSGSCDLEISHIVKSADVDAGAEL